MKNDKLEKLNKVKARMKKRFMEYAKNAEKMQKKAKSEGKYQNVEENKKQVASHNIYASSQQRAGTAFEKQPITNSITITDENSSKNIKNRMKKTDGSSEVSIQSTPTQTNPTFSRTDLGAVLYNRITINEINARYILSIILLDIKFRIINNLFYIYSINYHA